MKKYQILISKTAEKTLKTIPKKNRDKIIDVIEDLSKEPYPVGCKKLAGEENTFRVRVGDYRIIYEVDGLELLILVFKLGHRKEIYR